MRFFLLLLLLVTGTQACRCKPEASEGGAIVISPKTYDVTKKGRLVLTVTDAPGPITSAAARPPGGAVVNHPFLSASAYAPEEEDGFRKLLERSKSTSDFLERLRGAGCEVAPR